MTILIHVCPHRRACGFSRSLHGTIALEAKNASAHKIKKVGVLTKIGVHLECKAKG